MKVIELGVKVV